MSDESRDLRAVLEDYLPWWERIHSTLPTRLALEEVKKGFEAMMRSIFAWKGGESHVPPVRLNDLLESITSREGTAGLLNAIELKRVYVARGKTKEATSSEKAIAERIGYIFAVIFGALEFVYAREDYDKRVVSAADEGEYAMFRKNFQAVLQQRVIPALQSAGFFLPEDHIRVRIGKIVGRRTLEEGTRDDIQDVQRILLTIKGVKR
ncbi:MAG: hypothetical protein Q7S65_04215 [Nanoarchaeota archaeon]|nr:hypothetical protein [Nanoarchaeota archaeon]